MKRETGGKEGGVAVGCLFFGVVCVVVWSVFGFCLFVVCLLVGVGGRQEWSRGRQEWSRKRLQYFSC